MNFSKQTIRALVAIACVSVSATTLQAGFWDWFRCGKRGMPAATAPVAVTATRVEADHKDSKKPKDPQQAKPTLTATTGASTSAASHTTTATGADATGATISYRSCTITPRPAPRVLPPYIRPLHQADQTSHVQRFLNWLETKLSKTFSIHKLSESAATTKVFNAFGNVFHDVNDCQSYFTAHDLEEAQALRLYLAWQDYYAREREHGTIEVVYPDKDTDDTPLKREITTQQIMTPHKGIIIARWATYHQNPDRNWQCLEHGSAVKQRNVKGKDLIRNLTKFIQSPKSNFSKLISILANVTRLQVKWEEGLAILAIIGSVHALLIPTKIVNSFSPYSPQCPYPPQPFAQPQCRDIELYTGAIDLKGMQKIYPIDIAYDGDTAPCRVFQVWYRWDLAGYKHSHLQANFTTCCTASSTTEIECFSHNTVANRLVKETIPLEKPVDISLAFAPPKLLANPNSCNYNNDSLSICCVNDTHFIHPQQPHYVEIVPKEILTEIQPFLEYLERNVNPTDAHWMTIFRNLRKLSLPLLRHFHPALEPLLFIVEVIT